MENGIANKGLTKYKAVLVKRLNDLVSLLIVVDIVIDLHHGGYVAENNTIPPSMTVCKGRAQNVIGRCQLSS